MIVSLNLHGQDCSILSKANSIVPNRLCSPLSVNWRVSYTGVNNAGTSVQISYDWDDGATDIENAVNIGPGRFKLSQLTSMFLQAINAITDQEPHW